jgi:YegS/Rv2252/BmrU family lipid kinase
VTRCKVIVNPAAGKGAAAGQVDRLAALLRERGLDASLSLTAGPWHAAELARAAAGDGFDAVAAAGGDGTGNEVINGLMAAQGDGAGAPSFAVLPIGRGNDLAFGMGVPHDLEGSVAALAAGRTRAFDVGLVRGGDYPQGRFFGNGVGIGFDTLVGLEAARMTRVSGAAAYACAALKLLATYPEAPLLRLHCDGRELVRRAAMVSLMNGRRLGGVFHVTPGAATDDGLLDVCIAERTGRARMLGLFVRYLRGTQAGSRFVTAARGVRVAVQALAGTLAVHADGETICTGGTALEVECLPGRLRAIATN